MGICCGSKDLRLKPQERAISFKDVPPGTDKLKNMSLPPLTFFVLLSNLKLRKCSDYDLISVKLKIESLPACDFPLKEVDHKQKIQWKNRNSFDFTMTEYTMRRTFVTIEVSDKFKNVIGNLRINMYVIWTGPYHLDFKMELPKAKLCRISLDFKISQNIHLKIQNLMTELKPIEKVFLNDRFTFFISATIGSEQDPSDYAYHIVVTEPQRKSLNVIDLAQTHQVTRDKIIWKAELGKQQPLPQFDLNIAYYQIYPSSLHLTFWKVSPGFDDDDQPRYEIQSECFISLAKLLNMNSFINKDQKSAIQYMKGTINLQEKIWLHGAQVGKANIKLKVELQTHHKQMQACVLTEQGISVSSLAYHYQEKQENIDISSLKNLSNQIQREFINMSYNEQERNYFEVMKEKIKLIKNLLERELKVLKYTNKQKELIYEYKNQTELNAAQNLLIDLAQRTLVYIHKDQPDIQPVCWDILTIILKRGQLTLDHLGITKAEKELISQGKSDPSLVNKIEVSLKYQELLINFLKNALRSLQNKGDETQSYFAELFCSYSYFRIPPFREYILQIIIKESDPKIPEWRDTEFNLYEDANGNDEIYTNLFDWQNNLWKYIKNDQRYQNNDEQLRMILKEDRWKQRLAKRQDAFFSFLQKLAQQIEEISKVTKHIKWHLLPGYNRLLHAFLIQLRGVKIRHFNNRIKKCCVSLLANEKLLNIFVNILLKKVNLNQGDTVFTVIQFIDQFFTSVQVKRRPFPSTFDYKFFLERVRTILQGELQCCISQMLLVIYNHMDIFIKEFILELMLYLLSGNFFKFFFHWSYNLRNIFHVLVCTFIKKNKPDNILTRTKSDNRFRSFRRSSIQSDHISYLQEEVAQRYETIQKIIEEKIKPNVTAINNDHFYDKDLFRKMRSKIRDKREKNNIDVFQHFDQFSKLKTTNSHGSSFSLFIPRKFLYFQDEELMLKPITKSCLSYANHSLVEYKAISIQINRMLNIDPSYRMKVSLKRILDEKELKPTVINNQ